MVDKFDTERTEVQRKTKLVDGESNDSDLSFGAVRATFVVADVRSARWTRGGTSVAFSKGTRARAKLRTNASCHVLKFQ